MKWKSCFVLFVNIFSFCLKYRQWTYANNQIRYDVGTIYSESKKAIRRLSRIFVLSTNRYKIWNVSKVVVIFDVYMLCYCLWRTNVLVKRSFFDQISALFHCDDLFYKNSKMFYSRNCSVFENIMFTHWIVMVWICRVEEDNTNLYWSIDFVLQLSKELVFPLVALHVWYDRQMVFLFF